jgi:hypothetical protein
MNAKSVFESFGKEIISGTGDIVMRRRPACKLSTRQGSLYSAKTPKFTYLWRAERSRGQHEGGCTYMPLYALVRHVSTCMTPLNRIFHASGLEEGRAYAESCCA